MSDLRLRLLQGTRSQLRRSFGLDQTQGLLYISPIGEGRLGAIIAPQYVSQAAFFQTLH